MRTRRLRHALSAAALLCLSSAGADQGSAGRYTFHLEGGYFFGPGPIVPDTELPSGQLANIRFDARTLSGYCEFANDGTRAGFLSDERTRINQNIDAGRLLIGGGTSPILLTAVDGGPHRGTERYYLDAEYRFVWRVDIALDPGFAEGIIRLDDFVLTTGVVRIGRSLQSERGEPGGYDQAGTLPAGTYLAGRVGDFDQDGHLDGILVAAPHVPLEADMLPGAPVGNRRGFRTDVPIAANVSAELVLRGALHIEEPLRTTLDESARAAAQELARDLRERIGAAIKSARRASDERTWRSRVRVRRTLAALGNLEREAGALSATLDAEGEAAAVKAAAARVFGSIPAVIEQVASLNSMTDQQLRRSDAKAHPEPHLKNY